MYKIRTFVDMKFHKATYLCFAVFFITTKIGLAFNIHYCRGSIADVSPVFEANTGCGMQEMKQALASCETLQKKSCCEDEVVVIQNTDENLLVDTLQLSGNQFPAVLPALLVLHPVAFPLHQNNIRFIRESRSHSPPLYRLYCRSTFYA